MKGEASRRKRINRADLPPGKPGQVLAADPRSPRGVRWVDDSLRNYASGTSGVSASYTPGGIYGPAAAFQEWEAVGAPGSGEPAEFLTPSVGTPWTNTGAPRFDVEYRVDALSVLHFRGACEKADSTNEGFGSPILVMPVGLRFADNNFMEFPVSVQIAGVRSVQAVTVWGTGTIFPGHIRFPSINASVSSLHLECVHYLVDADY